MKAQKRARDKILRDEKNEMYQKGVEAREQERLWKRKVKELTKAKQDIPLELLVPVPNPKKI
jgi:transposase-like protein